MKLIIAITVIYLIILAAVIHVARGGIDPVRNYQRRIHKDLSTLRFFNHHHWMLATRHEKCVEVPWRTTCRKARVTVSRAKLDLSRITSDPIGAITLVFGPHVYEAINVATCESHFGLAAKNGQYLGMFQMGSHERATYGFGWTYLEQARSAHRYFEKAGWRPWSCKP